MSTQLERSVVGVAAVPIQPGQSPKSIGSTTGYNRETLKSIREWAKNSYNVSDRGRLPAEVLQAWEQARPRA